MRDVRLPIECTTDMPQRARAFVNEHLAALPSDVSDDVVLLTSELVTNVVIHGATPAYLHLAIIDDAVRVVVHDSGASTPVMPPAEASQLLSNGRGLLIVATLAKAWGVAESNSGSGKDVWFDVEARSPRSRSDSDTANAESAAVAEQA